MNTLRKDFWPSDPVVLKKKYKGSHIYQDLLNFINSFSKEYSEETVSETVALFLLHNEIEFDELVPEMLVKLLWYRTL